MATQKQKKVARKVVENLLKDSPLTGGEIVESSGYGPSMKKNPQVVLNSVGVHEELNKLGFDPEKAKEVVGEILQFGDSDLSRLAAAREIFKVHGTYAPVKSVNEKTYRLDDEELQKDAEGLVKLQRENTGSPRT